MFWIVNSIFIVAMTYLFGLDTALFAGGYVIIMAFIVFRYNNTAVKIIDAQRKEIERLSNQ